MMDITPDRLSDPDIMSETYESLPPIARMSNTYESDSQDVVFYEHHCDLTKVHLKVRDKFSELHSKAPEWRIELRTLQYRLEQPNLRVPERRDLEKRIATLNTLLSLISKEDGYPLWREYLTRSKDILLRYKELDPDESNHDLVYEFNQIIRDYCTIIIIRQINHDYTLCPGCDLPRVHQGGSLICQTCGIQDELISKESYRGTGRRHAYNKKNQYVSKDNFLKGLQRFQGKRSRKLPVDMFDKMDEYARQFGMPVSDEVKKMPLGADGRRGPKEYTRAYMKSLLDILDFKTYYNDINVITHLYWGWKLPDISEFEEQIKKDYELSQSVFNELHKDRQSSLILPYRLYRHLKRVGYPCNIEDFDIVTTPEIKQSYEDIWKEICDKLGWEFEPI